MCLQQGGRSWGPVKPGIGVGELSSEPGAVRTLGGQATSGCGWFMRVTGVHDMVPDTVTDWKEAKCIFIY